MATSRRDDNGRVDRETIARARRRKQAQEQLAEQRELEAALREELEERIGEADGPRLDEEAIAQMGADDAQLVRDGLAGGPADLQLEEETFWENAAEDEGEPEDTEAELEEEIARLQGEIERCRSRQRAYERYLELLSG